MGRFAGAAFASVVRENVGIHASVDPGLARTARIRLRVNAWVVIRKLLVVRLMMERFAPDRISRSNSTRKE